MYDVGQGSSIVTASTRASLERTTLAARRCESACGAAEGKRRREGRGRWVGSWGAVCARVRGGGHGGEWRGGGQTGRAAEGSGTHRSHCITACRSQPMLLENGSPAGREAYRALARGLNVRVKGVAHAGSAVDVDELLASDAPDHWQLLVGAASFALRTSSNLRHGSGGGRCSQVGLHDVFAHRVMTT